MTEKIRHTAPTVYDEELNFLSPLISEAKELASEYRKRRNAYDVKKVYPDDVPVEEARVGKFDDLGSTSLA